MYKHMCALGSCVAYNTVPCLLTHVLYSQEQYSSLAEAMSRDPSSVEAADRQQMERLATTLHRWEHTGANRRGYRERVVARKGRSTGWANLSAAWPDILIGARWHRQAGYLSHSIAAPLTDSLLATVLPLFTV